MTFLQTLTILKLNRKMQNEEKKNHTRVYRNQAVFFLLLEIRLSESTKQKL